VEVVKVGFLDGEKPLWWELSLYRETSTSSRAGSARFRRPSLFVANFADTEREQTMRPSGRTVPMLWMMLLLFVMVKACDNLTLTTANFKARSIIARIEITRTQKTKFEADLEQSGATK